MAIMPGRNILLSILAMPDGLSPLPLHTHAHTCAQTGMAKGLVSGGQGFREAWSSTLDSARRGSRSSQTNILGLLCFLEGPRIRGGGRVRGGGEGTGARAAGRRVAQSRHDCSFSGTSTLLCPLEASMSEQERAPAPAHHQFSGISFHLRIVLVCHLLWFTFWHLFYLPGQKPAFSSVYSQVVPFTLISPSWHAAVT